MSSKTKESHFSLVLETPALEPPESHRYFLSKLEVETDVADLALDLRRGQKNFTIIDTRTPQAFEECHIPGAINLPRITEETTSELPKGKLCVVYCWGPACNGSTKGAAKLSALGFKTKELIGGMEYWCKERCPVEGTLGYDAEMYKKFE